MLLTLRLWQVVLLLHTLSAEMGTASVKCRMLIAQVLATTAGLMSCAGSGPAEVQERPASVAAAAGLSEAPGEEVLHDGWVCLGLPVCSLLLLLLPGCCSEALGPPAWHQLSPPL